MASRHQGTSSARHVRAKEIFLEACALDGQARNDFLDQECAGDPGLRQEVDSLLEHHDDEDGDAWLSRIPGALTTTRSAAPAFGSSRPHNPSDELVFDPGTVVAKRYRIVDRLGGGGMGEVYRAEDLVLHESVALKFLRPSPNDRWLDEVRLARQVTHPNVCRVFDVSEVDGRPFISMEYVDGEDLASLLNRIGRLPRDRTVFIARQLFSGLAAAHAKGVLHRDLKPANIMIDGRGEVRITDFGIASREAEDTVGPLAGTPAYMAPEQFNAEDVTARTDLYSLGLVLYELTTGVFPFEAEGRLGFARAHIEETPPPPSAHVTDIDPTLERVILKCLEKMPEHRPSSALAVAAALPGGDPLRLAIDIGATPSPEMVAEAGGHSTLSTRAAAWLASLAALLLTATLAFSDKANRFDTAGLDLPPEVLAEKAREKLRSFGWPEPPADEAFGFAENIAPLSPLEAGRGPLDPSAPGASSILFWYRQSPVPMEPSGLQNLLYWGGLIGPYDPPLSESGMALVLLHPNGNLDHLEVKPLREPKSVDPSNSQQLFDAALRSAGLSPERLEKRPSRFAPPFFSHDRVAYRGTSHARPDLELNLRLASHDGRLVFFRMVPDSDAYPEMVEPWPYNLIDHWDEWWEVLIFLAVIAAVPLMRHNLRRGRGDQRSARRLAAFVFAVTLGLWLVRGPHVADLTGEAALLRLTLGQALLQAGIVWLFYIALEPYARRLWPHSLISWTRLVSGRVTDPLVARSLIYGVLFGAGWTIMGQLDHLLPRWLGLAWTPKPIGGLPFDYAVSASSALVGLGEQLMAAISDSVFSLLLLLLARLLFRQPNLAVFGYIVLVSAMYAPNGVHPVLSWFTVGLAVAATEALVLVRFGLVTYASAALVSNLLSNFPLTLDVSTWYARTGFTALGVAIALAVFGLMNATAKHRSLRELSTERRTSESRPRRS